MKKNILLWSLVIVVAILGLYSYKEFRTNNDLKNDVTNSYGESFNALLEDFEQMNGILSKIVVSNDNKFIRKEAVTLYGLNLKVNENLSDIGINHSVSVDLEKFLNKTTGYYYALSNKDSITSKDRKDIENIYEAQNKLYNNLGSLSDYVNYSNEGYDWIKNQTTFLSNTNNMLDNTIASSNDEIKEYPTLIYDGAFSDDIKLDEKIILGKKLSKSEAKNVVSKYLNNKNVKINYDSACKGNIECYRFNYELNKITYYIDVSKYGGKIISINSNYKDNQNENKRVIEAKQGIKLCKEYLSAKGFNNMKDNYYEVNGNILTTNFTYNEKGVVIYPDLIKVKISLIDKKIIGMECSNYYISHKNRNINLKGILSEKKVLSKVNSNVKVSNIRLALIPKTTNSKKEILCYEVRGVYKKETYLIYINVKNGQEENILKVIRENEGMLTL